MMLATSCCICELIDVQVLFFVSVVVFVDDVMMTTHGSVMMVIIFDLLFVFIVVDSLNRWVVDVAIVRLSLV